VWCTVPQTPPLSPQAVPQIKVPEKKPFYFNAENLKKSKQLQQIIVILYVDVSTGGETLLKMVYFHSESNGHDLICRLQF